MHGPVSLTYPKHKIFYLQRILIYGFIEAATKLGLAIIK